MIEYSLNQLCFFSFENIEACNKKILDNFFILYESTFSSYGDGFEPTSNIRSRLFHKDSVFPVSSTFLLTYIDENDEVIGGAILEHYVKSKTALLTYLFVKDKGTGLGSFIIKKGLDWLLTKLRITIKAIFFETENPSYYFFESQKLIEIKKRLKFFKNKIGAKLVDIPYVQPALSKGGEKVHSLYLMVLPQFLKNPYRIKKKYITSFLNDFYNELIIYRKENIRDNDSLDFENDIDLIRAEIHIDINILQNNFNRGAAFDEKLSEEILKIKNETEKNYYNNDNKPSLLEIKNFLKEIKEKYNIIISSEEFFLSEIPSYSFPRVALERCSVAIHITEQTDSPGTSKFCPFFHSYETDLLTQKFQESNSPCRSTMEVSGTITLEFPTILDYISEGRFEKLILHNHNTSNYETFSRYSITLTYSLSSSFFEKSKILIWHLVLSPNSDSYINEYELLQLTKFFSGKQEECTPDLKIINIYIHTFYKDDAFASENKTHEIFNFLSGALKKCSNYKRNTITQQYSIEAGTIQIDTAYLKTFSGKDLINFSLSENMQCDLKTTDFWVFFYNCIGNIYSTKNSSKNKSFVIPKNCDNFKYVLAVLSAFSIGILDFKRLEDEEIIDTLNILCNSLSESSFIIMNRGTILQLCHNDNLFDAVADNIKISPYLIIPNSILSHNQLIGQIVEDKITKEEETVSIKLNFFRRLFFNPLGKNYYRKSKLVNLIERKIYIEKIQNVFHYPTEIEIYEYGMKQKSINITYDYIENYRINLVSDLDSISRSQSDLFQIRITLISLIFTFIQASEFLGFEKGGIVLKVIVCLMFVLAVLYLSVRKFRITSS